MKKAIIIIQSESGQHKSSIIRTISQILIGLSEKTVVNVGELGLSRDIASVVELEELRVGVATQHDVSNNTYDMIRDLNDRNCAVILCAIQIEADDSDQIDVYAENHNFTVTRIKSNWSEKLEVNYLTDKQVAKIVHEIKTVKEGANA